MKKLFFWVGMKRDVVHFIAKCLECQQVKADHHHPAGLLQPHDVPMSKWEVISMDFVVGLPLTSHRHNAPPYEALYGRPCRTPLSWDRLEDRITVGLELI
jgi:hypothetical protein